MGADETSHEAIVQVFAANASGEAATAAVAKSISSAAGIDEEITSAQAAESVEGSLEFEFGEDAAAFGLAYEDASTRVAVEQIFRDALARNLLDVNASDVKLSIRSIGRQLAGARAILPSAPLKLKGSSLPRALGPGLLLPNARRLASHVVDYGIRAHIGTGAGVSTQVTAINTSGVTTSLARLLQEAAAANPALADLADVAPGLGPTLLKQTSARHRKGH